MKRVEWVPGAQHAIVRDGFGMLLADDVPREQVLRVWQELDRLDALDGLGGLLDILRDVTGRGLGSLPSFAMSVIDHRGLHVAVRGSFNVHVVDLDDDEHVVRGDEASVWVERNFDTAVVADVLLAPDDLDGSWLPVVGGVLPAAGIRQCLAERTAASGDAGAPVADAADPDPSPAPRAEPPVEAEPEPALEPEPDPVPSHETWVEEGPSEAAPTTRRFASLLSPHTVMHDVEEAAVRPDDPELDDHDPAPSPPAEEPSAADPPQVEVAPVPVVPAPVAPAEVATPPSFISGVPSRAAYVAPAPAAPSQVSSRRHRSQRPSARTVPSTTTATRCSRPRTAPSWTPISRSRLPRRVTTWCSGCSALPGTGTPPTARSAGSVASAWPVTASASLAPRSA